MCVCVCIHIHTYIYDSTQILAIIFQVPWFSEIGTEPKVLLPSHTLLKAGQRSLLWK
jgi:hypothetical protein